jgi:hypothetical protein
MKQFETIAGSARFKFDFTNPVHAITDCQEEFFSAGHRY